MKAASKSTKTVKKATTVKAAAKPAAKSRPAGVAKRSAKPFGQDGKALQAGTSHHLGQHFAKVFNIRFQDDTGKLE